MNVSVLLFFLHNVLATFLIGGKLLTKRDSVFKNFGVGLILDGIAFAIWSTAILLRPQNLEQYVTIGVIFFITSLVFLFAAGIQNIETSTRKILIMLGAIVAVVILYMRTYLYPSAPAFSAEGLFFFNPHPIIQMIYIFGLALAALPAIEALAGKFKTPFYATLVRYGFIAEVVGGTILITSTDISSANGLALYLTGWVIGIVYFALWTTLLLSRKAWAGVS